MDLPQPLIEGRLRRRYKRFFAEIELDSGEVITAHCPNPGSMLGVLVEGGRVWASRHDDPKRKLKYSWQLAEVEGALVAINTQNPNSIVEEAIRARRMPLFEGYADLRREVKYGAASRIDLLLEDAERPPCYLEIKNVHLSREAGLAEFPDSVTARGAKHLEELGEMARSGVRAVMLFVVQRSDCNRFCLAADLDPGYAAAFAAAQAAGVEAYCWDCEITKDESAASVCLRREIDIVAD
ncbi:MAG: DNA/RNA nuclease SfsA [Parvularculaceae bacterium]